MNNSSIKDLEEEMFEHYYQADLLGMKINETLRKFHQTGGKCQP